MTPSFSLVWPGLLGRGGPVGRTSTGAIQQPAP
eukprot:CAMPEP_0171126264 /NCGR_PEP_ID=MMETSP0766_2-20121228/112971_1 /TAXON_ID=439317 /ORGANISM="Gambierdiscus australes, Strain CAWD 149" /LENGTH=32 /DNA_ID= /DNA_START= /DNA_END= /DNA_ORIENTATION=